MTLSIIIPTCGRSSLARTLASIATQLKDGDQVVVVGDGDQPKAWDICQASDVARLTYDETAPTHRHGGTQRQYGMQIATGDALLFMDDDDIYVPGALDLVREGLTQRPDCLLLFRFLDKHGGLIWRDPVIRETNVGTPCFVVPNRREWLGTWTERYEGDYDFIRSTVDRWPGGDDGVVWVADLLADCRPTTGEGRGDCANPPAPPAETARPVLGLRVPRLNSDVKGNPAGGTARSLRILLVWASAAWSVRDVTTGLRGALLRAGHDVHDFRLDQRIGVLARGLGIEIAEAERRREEVTCMATEGVLAAATRFQADLVLVISGLLFHELGLWLLAHYQIPTALVLTESPYEDDQQQHFVHRYPDLTVFTQERISAQRFGWHYLPAAYDDQVHQPAEPDLGEACDVVLVGTGFAERQRLLEAIDWTGIQLRIRGVWPEMTPASPIYASYVHGPVENADLPKVYAAAKICLNPYRFHPTAESLNPRAYELAACRAFQLADWRAEGAELFGTAVPTYRNADELSDKLRYYLAQPEQRQACADRARARVQGQNFDRRVADLLAVVTADRQEELVR